MSSKQKSSDSTVEHFTGKDMAVSVSQPREGFFCTLTMKARVPLPPEEVFEILTNPDNVGIFRSVKKVLNRKVVFDSDGLLQAEVEHLAIWKLGFLKGTFKIKLLVEQNEPERTIRFRLAGAKGFMKDFTGGWKIHPHPYSPTTALTATTIPLPPASITPTDTPSSSSNTTMHWHEQHKDHHRHGPLHTIHSAFKNLEGHLFHNNNHHHHHGGRDIVAVVQTMKPETSLVELEQSMAPAIVPPAPLAGIVRKISAAQIRHIMEDLMNEADRRIEEREGRTITEGRRWRRRRKKNKDDDDDNGGSGLAAHIKELDD